MNIGIVVFTDFPEGSAAARRVHLFGKGLTERGHCVHVVVPHSFHPGSQLQEIDGMHIHSGIQTTVASSGTIAVRIAARQFALRMVDKLARAGLDWLMLYNLGLEGVPFLLAARRHGARVIAEYCDIRVRPQQPSFGARAQHLWGTAADLVTPRLTQLNIAISKLLEQRLRSTAPRTPTLIIPPLVDTDQFQRRPTEAEAFRTRWGIGDSPLISYLGGYWNVDGVKVLLEATAKLALSGVQFKVVISGAHLEGRDCDDVPRLVNELGLQQHVVQTGWLPTGQVIAAMSAADVLVVPKIDHVANQAGVPTKLAEYLAVGRSIICSRVGDIPLYLSHNQDSLLCAPGDPSALADALSMLIRSPELRDRLSINARHTALNHFDYRNAASRIEAALINAV
jgi:glycosyltransferase involved in cell wall biosynthesis